MVLMRTAPIWTALIVIFVTKQEKGSWNLLIAITLGFVGVLFVARPPQLTPLLKRLNLVNYEQSSIYGNDYLLGVVETLIGSIISSMIQIVTSSLMK